MKFALVFLFCIFGFSLIAKQKQPINAQLVAKYGMMAEGFGNSNQYDSAIYYYKKSIELSETLIKTPEDRWSKYWLNRKGDLAHMIQRSGDPLSGLEIINEILPTIKRHFANDELYALVLKLKGIMFINLGKYDSTIYYYKKSLEVSSTLVNTPQRPVAFTLNNLGHVYSILGEYDLSKQYHSQALETRKRLFKNNTHLDIAQSYLNLGNVFYFTNDIDNALAYWKEVLNITDLLGNKDTRYASMALGNLGEVYKEIGDLESALFFNEKALNLKLEIYGEKHARTAHSYATLAGTILALGRTDEAILLFEKSVRIKTEVVGRKHPELAEIFNNYGRLFEENQKFDRALEYYHKALIANVPSFEDSLNVYATPNDFNYLNPNFLLESLELKTSILKSYGDSESLKYAMSHIISADQFIQKIRMNTTTSTDQIQLTERFNEIYEHGIQIALKIYNDEPTSSNADLVFQFFEKNKSVALNFSIKENSARNYIDMPGQLIAEIDSLKHAIESTQNLFSIGTPNDSVSTTLFNTKRLYEDLMSKVEKKYPNYFAFKYDFETPRIAHVRNYFEGNNEALIEYFMGRNSLYVAIISKSIVRFLDLGKQDSLKQRVIDFRKFIASQNESYSYLTEKIYDEIFLPVDNILDSNNVTHISIINDGILTLLPFELLDTKREKSFLFLKYNIHYANSSKMLINGNHDGGFNNKLISYAPKFIVQENNTRGDVVRNELAKLPGALLEASEVGNLFGGKVILENSATESSFKANAQEFGLIHLATHAIIDDENPDNSRLIFSLSDTTREDGYLHAYEIYNLKLNAQLITLSACNTGFGKIRKGEGVMSLSRAFAYAGVPATVVCLWPASDKSTPELMKYFYQNLKEGQTKDIALNNARKQYLATAEGKARHPFYWGGFVLIGNNNPIKKDNTNLASLLAFVFLITMLPLILVIKNKYLSLDN